MNWKAETVKVHTVPVITVTWNRARMLGPFALCILLECRSISPGESSFRPNYPQKTQSSAPRTARSSIFIYYLSVAPVGRSQEVEWREGSAYDVRIVFYLMYKHCTIKKQTSGRTFTRI